MTVKQVKKLIKTITGKTPSCVKRWSSGFIFNINGEWYQHDSTETKQAAMLLERAGYYVQFPCMGAFWYVEL